MKKILVPIDFSECSMLALDVAADIARRSKSEIYLLHVVEVPAAYSDFSSFGEWDAVSGGNSEEMHYMVELLKATKERMKNVMNLPLVKDLKVYDAVEAGSISLQVAEASKKHNIDLIVMGTHGSTGVNELVVGSNAEKVVRFAKTPVLTIKEKYNKAPKNIVFASDFSEDSDLAFNQLTKIADLSGAKIHMLTVNTFHDFKTTREMQGQFEGFCRRNKVNTFKLNIYNDKLKETGIINFANDVNADLIAIGTHGRTGISRFFTQSISEDIVNHAFCPVLTINISKEG